MKLGSRSRIVLAAAVLSASALLAPAAPAGSATTPPCVPDHCDSVVVYYSDATYREIVGVFGGDPDACGVMAWGVTSPYAKHVWRTC